MYICGLLALAISSICTLLGEETSSGGSVYGPKAGFNISAPEGWVVDNESGKGQDLPCVLYPKGSSRSDAKTVMSAKLAGTQWEDVNAFVAMAIKEMKATHGTPKEKIASGKTKDGLPYFINEYPATKNYSKWERALTRCCRQRRDDKRKHGSRVEPEHQSELALSRTLKFHCALRTHSDRSKEMTMTMWDLMLWTAVAIPVGFIVAALINAATAPQDPFE
jgi:hypothetical protein